MTDTEDVEIFYFDDKHDKLSAEDLKCPCCGVKYMMHIPYVNASCKKCGTRYQSDFKMSMFRKKIPDLFSWMAHKNMFKIRATERYEDDIIKYHTLVVLMKNWDVSDIEETTEQHRRCNDCGVCLNCFTCKQCGKAFEKDENRRKLICPHCKSTNFVQTYFKKVITAKDNKNIKHCPFCNSDKVVMTRTPGKTRCHLCDSKDLAEPIKERVFWVTVERKGAYKK